MIRTAVVAALLLLLMSGGSGASESEDKLGSILVQQRDLQAGLAAGQDYGLTPRELSAVRKAQAEVFTLTEGKISMDQLNIEDKIRLDNALERINTQVKGGDTDHIARGEQDVCKRVQRTGTTVKSTVCATQSEWDRVREDSRESLEKRRICADCGR